MAHLTEDHVKRMYAEFGELKVLDDIIRHRANDEPPAPILGYPKFEDSVSDYEVFTGKQVDSFVENAAGHLSQAGLQKEPTGSVVAILAPSNVDFIVTFFALSRLGFTVMCLSLRIKPEAIVNLLRQTQCAIIVHGPQGGSPSSSTLEAVRSTCGMSIKTLRIPTRAEYERTALIPWYTPSGVTNDREADREAKRNQLALVMHSSGSTGLPKPVFLTHRNVLTHAVQGAGMDNFGSLPLYHMYGVSTTLQAMYLRRRANLFNASLPLTAANLIGSIEAVQPKVVHAVPYALGLLAEKSRGVELLRQCAIVTAAGARTPDELGDRLVKAGVNLGVVFGTTEAGLAGDTMRREPGDDSWNYIRFYANIRKYLYMDPVDETGDGKMFECVYLKGHPGLSESNSDEPVPGSWRSKDVFTPHPTIPNAWKYITRVDDRVTLVNGEKVLPLPIEGCIRQHEMVREAVVFGVDRPVPGLLLFRGASANGVVDDEQFIDAVWPVISEANSHAEAFSQITRDMVCVLPSDVEYPRTDKGSIIRAQVYKQFAEQIQQLYERLEGGTQDQGVKLDLSQQELEVFIKSKYEEVIGTTLESLDTDFFAAGVDSLKAIQIRRELERHLNLHGTKLSRNVVYERRNARELALYLAGLGRDDANNVQVNGRSGTALMGNLIAKYSYFGDTVILTGASGSLGTHILAQMLQNKTIRKVYCFVRGNSPMHRLLDGMKDRMIDSTNLDITKVVALNADPSKPHFGLNQGIFAQLQTEVSLIVHAAWPVNFNISLESFEPHLEGLRNLLQFSLANGARCFFCSSVSVAHNLHAGKTSVESTGRVAEAPITDLRHAGYTGYAQSKLVGEHMVLAAARAGAKSHVLRIGQLVGDTQNGVWNEKEFIPSMVRSAMHIGALPDLKEDCSWLPVDVSATAIMEIMQATAAPSKSNATDQKGPSVFYNVVNPATFPWSWFLGELRNAGLEFKTVPFKDWIAALERGMTNDNGGKHSAEEEETNPALKLIDYFSTMYNSSGEDCGVSFDAEKLKAASAIMRESWTMIDGGHVKQFLERWTEKWTPRA